MQLYVADYLGDTRHLSTEQHGAYLLLLMSMWRAGGRLPNDDQKLARIAGLSLTKWRRIAGDVMEFFTIVGDEITQKRLASEIEKAKEKSQKRAIAGAKGGTAKSQKNKETPVANATAMPQHSSDTRYQSIPEPIGSEANPPPTPVDLKSEIFGPCLKWLAEHTDTTTAKVRPLVGKWCRDYGDATVLQAMTFAARDGPIDPVSWITKHLGERKANGRNPPRTERSDREAIFRWYEMAESGASG